MGILLYSNKIIVSRLCELWLSERKNKNYGTRVPDSRDLLFIFQSVYAKMITVSD